MSRTFQEQYGRPAAESFRMTAQETRAQKPSDKPIWLFLTENYYFKIGRTDHRPTNCGFNRRDTNVSSLQGLNRVTLHGRPVNYLEVPL